MAFGREQDDDDVCSILFLLVTKQLLSYCRFLRFSPFDEYKVWKKHVDSGKGTFVNKLVGCLASN